MTADITIPPKTEAELRAIFADMRPTPRVVLVAAPIVPEKSEGGIYLNDEQREQQTVQEIHENGAVIIASGEAAKEIGIHAGDRAYLSVMATPIYQMIRSGVVLRAVEMHFIVATKAGDNSPTRPHAAQA